MAEKPACRSTIRQAFRWSSHWFAAARSASIAYFQTAVWCGVPSPDHRVPGISAQLPRYASVRGCFADTPAGGQLFLIEVNDVHLGLLPHELAGVHEGAVRSASQVNSEDARLLREIVQLVAGTAPARIRFPQHAAREQVVDVAQRRVWRALGDRRPLAAGELAFKAIE